MPSQATGSLQYRYSGGAGTRTSAPGAPLWHAFLDSSAHGWHQRQNQRVRHLLREAGAGPGL